MRSFNQDEQTFLNKIIERRETSGIYGVPFNDFLFQIANKYEGYIEINQKNQEVKLICDSSNRPVLEKDPVFVLADFNFKVMTIVSLLEYLLKNNLIYLFDFTYNEAEFTHLFHSREFKKNPISSPLRDKKSTSFILEYHQKKIYLSEELVQYVNSGFKTAEEKRHEQSINMAVIFGWSSLAVAVISALIAVLSTLISLII